MNILIETGGCLQWRTQERLGFDVAGDALQRYRYEPGLAQPFVLEEEKGLARMSAPETLADFIRWGAQAHPARRYALVLWGHGGGSHTGLLPDERFDGKYMNLAEPGQALTGGGVHFDTLVMDACMMANLETALAVRDHADWLVASEEIAAGSGTAYHVWLNELYAWPDCDGYWLGRNVCDSVQKKIADLGDEQAKHILTFSPVDTSKVDAVAERFDEFWRLVGGLYEREPKWFGFLCSVIGQTESYGAASDYMMDIGAMLTRLYSAALIDGDVRTMCGYKYEPVQSEAFQATAGYKVPYLSVGSYPVALNVVVSDSNVKVNQTAQIVAASDIAMRSENETRAMANAASGLIQIPVSIAVNVVSGDARSLAKGELTAGGNVLIASRGAQYVVARSAHGSSQTLLNSGLYGALNVVVQNVTARTGLSDDEKGSDMTRITAGGNVRVKSETLADVRDNVTSGVSPNSPRSSYTLAIDGVGNFLSTFFMKYLIQKGKIKDNNAAIKAAMGFLSASEYHIERVNDPGDDAGGTINSARTVMENGEPVVRGTYSVKPGYVGVVRYRWLVPGEDSYHMGVAGFDEASGTFSFTPPAKNVYIELITTETSGAAGVEAGNDDKGVQNVNDIVEDATGGAKKSADEQSDAGDIKLTFNVGNTGDGYNFGTLLTRQCDENGKSILTTSAGNTVEIVPNPIVNYKVKDDTITVRYYEPEDYYAKYMQVKAKAQGEYVFKVPQGISANRGIEVMASFEQITTASDTNLHDYQVSGIAGAIAAQVSGFDTQARVMKGATLNLLSGGALDVSARSGLTFDLTADASGKRQQGSTVGVGAGIAVGVRGADGALRLSGDVVSITANDKSRLAARAGGLSVSKGASVGSGLAATILASSDTVNASVGDNTAITAGELDVSAVKQAATIDDYHSAEPLLRIHHRHRRDEADRLYAQALRRGELDRVGVRHRQARDGGRERRCARRGRWRRDDQGANSQRQGGQGEGQGRRQDQAHEGLVERRRFLYLGRGQARHQEGRGRAAAGDAVPGQRGHEPRVEVLQHQAGHRHGQRLGDGGRRGRL